MESSPLEIVKRSAGVTVPGISTTRIPVSPTAPSYNYVPDPQDAQKSTAEDPFYNGCGEQKSCFGTPSGCIATRNCKAIVSTSVRGEQYEFELKTQTGAYVAVGFSDDDKMGDDSTIECVRDGNGLNAYAGYTEARPNLNAFRNPNVSRIGFTLRSNA